MLRGTVLPEDSLPFFVAAILVLNDPPARAQAKSGLHTFPRITGPVDETDRVPLASNVRPEVRPENDRGRVSDALASEHMLLQLKRSPEKEEALQELIAELHRQGSPSFHH